MLTMPELTTQQNVPKQTDERLLPRGLAPQRGEAGVLSLLAVREGPDWVMVCGSLLSVPEAVAKASWAEWADLQPATRGPRPAKSDPDLGATFTEEPFSDLRITRMIVDQAEWREQIERIEAGKVETPEGTYRLDLGEWSACKLFAQNGLTDPHRVLARAKRPVRGVAAAIREVEIPWSDGNWVRGGASKPMEKHTREELLGKDIFTSWPENLLGIGWHGSVEHPPPRAFVVGRVQAGIWIADVVPDYDNAQLKIVLAWEADRIDPFSCSVLVRAERDGAPLMTRHWNISDLPGELVVNKKGQEPRDLAWNERTIDLRLPRGPRRTDWGMSLLGPDGWLLDELPVVRRAERMEFSMQIAGTSEPFSTTVVGDRQPTPTEAERDQEAEAARELEEQTRAGAARRRLATADELEHYLRWRFSARAGELLLIDRYLLDGKEETVQRVVEFLATFNRPIRALVTKVSESAPPALAAAPEVEVRKLAPSEIHDRLWIVGDSGLSVGASVNRFLRDGPNATIPATTAVELPFADTAAWREKFDGWWPTAEPP
jgi:hypothetical protein